MKTAACNRMAVWFCAAFIAAASWASAQPKPVPPPPPKPDALEIARTQVRQKNLAAASITLQSFLRSKAAADDARTPEAVKLLLTTAQAQSKELEAKQPIPAARALLTPADVPAMAEHRDLLRTTAYAILQKGYETSVTKKDPAQSLAIAELFSATYPDSPALADEATLRQHRLKAAAAFKKTGRPEHLLAEVRQLKKAGVTPEELKQAELEEAQLSLRVAQRMFERGWYQECTATIVDELQSKNDHPPDLKRSLAQLLEKSLMGSITANVQLGNYAMLNESIELYGTPENTAGDPTKLAKYKTALGKIIGQTPREFTTSAPIILGDATWSDDGGGYLGKKDIVIGDRSKEAVPNKGVVTVQPGFVMDGGRIRCQRGKLTFAGTADRPIILRNVKLECDYVGTIAAQYTLFQNCTFRKSGGVYWIGGYSSKWEFDDCLLLSSRFGSLSKVDYGIKLQRCTFLQCFFPERSLNDDSTKDSAAIYRGNWNKVTEATLYDCKLTPSWVWGAQGSAYFDCEVRATSTFHSMKDLEAAVAIPSDDARFAQDLIDRTALDGTGRVTYPVTLIDKQVPKPSPLWRWAPARPAPAADGEDDDPKAEPAMPAQ